MFHCEVTLLLNNEPLHGTFFVYTFVKPNNQVGHGTKSGKNNNEC